MRRTMQVRKKVKWREKKELLRKCTRKSISKDRLKRDKKCVRTREER